MAQYFSPPPQNYGAPQQQQNLNFFQSTYANPGVSGHSTPAAAASGYGGFGGMGQMGSGSAPLHSSDPSNPQGTLAPGWLAAFSTSGYDNEPPLLEELGVNFSHIKTKTLAVLNPLKQVDQHMMDDSDVAGPILFFLMFGTFLLLSGKVHFGYVYGVALLGSISLHVLLGLMAPGGNALNYIRSASVLGYCLLPLVASSAIGVVFPLDGALGYALTVLAILWSTMAASGMFTGVLRVGEMRWLVAYPVGLWYGVFGIMSIFGSKASSGGK